MLSGGGESGKFVAKGAGLGMAFEPAVEGRLGFFEEAKVVGETGLRGGFEGELLGDGVERSGDGDGDLLGVEGSLGIVASEGGVPGLAEVV